MTKFTKILLLTLAVFAVGLFLGSADVLAMAPDCAEGMKACGNGCIGMTEVCPLDGPSMETCEKATRNLYFWLMEGAATPPQEALEHMKLNCFLSSPERWEMWRCLAKAPSDLTAVGVCITHGM